MLDRLCRQRLGRLWMIARRDHGGVEQGGGRQGSKQGGSAQGGSAQGGSARAAVVSGLARAGAVNGSAGSGCTPPARLMQQRLPCSDTVAEAFAELWARAGWSDEHTIQAWLDAGADPEDFAVAEALAQRDITPALAKLRIRRAGELVTILDLVRSGRMSALGARAALVQRKRLPPLAVGG
jgi:hypothetical protein